MAALVVGLSVSVVWLAAMYALCFAEARVVPEPGVRRAREHSLTLRSVTVHYTQLALLANLVRRERERGVEICT